MWFITFKEFFLRSILRLLKIISLPWKFSSSSLFLPMLLLMILIYCCFIKICNILITVGWRGIEECDILLNLDNFAPLWFEFFNRFIVLSRRNKTLSISPPIVPLWFVGKLVGLRQPFPSHSGRITTAN